MASASHAATDYVWFEAESATSTNFSAPEKGSFAPANETEAAVLSGGKWMSTEGTRDQTLFLEYRVDVPASATYNFYARKFWHHGPFRYKWDNKPWREVRKHALLDEAGIRLFLGANWVGLNQETLAKGAHTLRVELLEKSGAAAFDAWLLTPRAFVPRGKVKPGEKLNLAQAGYFAFEPDEDTFKPSPIDLRFLNEKQAGDDGFIIPRGEELVHGKSGKPVRFWAVNSGGDVVDLDAASLGLMARSLAKSGVNMVRLHGGVWQSDNWREPDLEHIKRVREFVRVMKGEGIYTCLSIYFPLWLRPDKSLAGYNGDKNPFASLFFNPDFQAVYRRWWTTLLNTRDKNGLALKDDPAVALAELTNEDSYLFWTFNSNNIPAPQMAILERAFGDYLKAKYGSVQAALTRWGGNKVTGDEAAEGRAGFRPLWELTSSKDARSQDTARFLTLHQKAFFDNTRDFLRAQGYKAAIYGSNWITADARVLGPLDKYSNTGAGVMDRHGYFGGAHEGARAGYSISQGDRYADRSALLLQNAKGEDDYDVPIFELRHNDLPSTITEINWTAPNRFRAEFPLMSAAYGALQGNDGTFFFATGTPSWDQTWGKFSIRTPAIQGQFPAAALIYRLGLVKPGAKVADVSLKLDDLFALKGAPISAPINLDEIRKVDIPAGGTAAVENVASLDPLAYAVGKVGLRFSDKGGPSQLADFSRYIDRNSKTVRSQTGELFWDYGHGLMTINAPQVQAATGFLGRANRIALKDVSFTTPMEYGALTVVALDGQPIARSKKMLVQVMSEEVPFGWETKSAANGLREITNLGGAPMNVKQMSGMVSFLRADAGKLRVTPLDLNGYPRKVTGSTNALALALRPDVMYYLVEAPSAP